MKMTSDLEKELEVFIQQRKEELFRDKVILSKEEEDLLKEYIHDYINPEWRDVIIDNTLTNFEVSNVGHVRNIKKKTLWEFEKMYENDYLWVSVPVQGR